MSFLFAIYKVMQKYNKLNDCNALGIEAFVEALFCYSLLLQE